MTPTSQSSPVVASLKGCSKRYPGVIALENANFDMRAGEVRALLGKNGAGKSTMIRLLTGAETPDSGSVTIGGTQLHAAGSGRAAEAFGLGVRVVFDYDSTHKIDTVSFDILYGVTTLDKNMIVKVQVQTPTRLSKEQKELLCQFDELCQGEEEGFFSRLFHGARGKHKKKAGKEEKVAHG